MADRFVQGRSFRSLFKVSAAAAFGCSIILSSAIAQYSLNPNSADETKPGIKFFGWGKDDQGTRLEGVRIVINGTMVFVTDNTGLFRGFLESTTLTPNDVTIECSKAGYDLVKLNKRPGPVGMKPMVVQVDCVLQAAK